MVMVQSSPLVRSAFCPMKIDHTSGQCTEAEGYYKTRLLLNVLSYLSTSFHLDENRQTNLVSKGSSNTEKYPRPIFLNKRGNIHYFSPEMLEKLLEKFLYRLKYKSDWFRTQLLSTPSSTQKSIYLVTSLEL